MLLVASRQQIWTHRSVLALAGDSDPVQVITKTARNKALEAMQSGWKGPPYDPFALAEMLGIPVVARQDIAEARTVPAHGGYLIEFNPTRPRNRIKYSICHELAHTFFPDCAERVRNRLTHEKMRGDDWQLETLCNIAAAELLLPIGTVPALTSGHLTIEAVLDARREHQVSVEAVLLRAVRLTEDQCCVFSASQRDKKPNEQSGYAIDYAVSSPAWRASGLQSGAFLPRDSSVKECSAIGVVAKGHENWEGAGKVRVECMGIPPYPNQLLPRVVGIVRPQKQSGSKLATITYVPGDATAPRTGGLRIVAQVVNDAAFTWGGGFSLSVRKKWPAAQSAYREWASTDRNLRLGNIHLAPIDGYLTVASLIAQHGFGPSARPRIRYVHLRNSLRQLADVAIRQGASVHMPKIGCGQAGGIWTVVKELVEDELCARGIKVYVYESPGLQTASPAQRTLELSKWS